MVKLEFRPFLLVRYEGGLQWPPSRQQLRASSLAALAPQHAARPKQRRACLQGAGHAVVWLDEVLGRRRRAFDVIAGDNGALCSDTLSGASGVLPHLKVRTTILIDVADRLFPVKRVGHSQGSRPGLSWRWSHPVGISRPSRKPRPLSRPWRACDKDRTALKQGELRASTPWARQMHSLAAEAHPGRRLRGWAGKDRSPRNA